MKTLIETLDSVVIKRPRRMFYHSQHIFLDKGYDYPEIERAVIKRKYIPHIRRRGESLKRYCSVINQRDGSWREARPGSIDSESY